MRLPFRPNLRTKESALRLPDTIIAVDCLPLSAKERNDTSYEASYVVNSCHNTLQIRAGIVELHSEGGQGDHSSEDTYCTRIVVSILSLPGRCCERCRKKVAQ